MHAALLRHLMQAARAQLAELVAAGQRVAPLPDGVAQWLPTGSPLRFVVLAGLAIALAAAGGRRTLVLPAAVVLVGLGPDGGAPLSLDGAWGTAWWLANARPDPLGRLWAGAALDATLLLLPAVLYLQAARTWRRLLRPAPTTA